MKQRVRANGDVLPDAPCRSHVPSMPAFAAVWTWGMSRLGPIRIDAARLSADLEFVAALLQQDERYLPIFERLERELEIALAREDTMSRARKILAAKAEREAAAGRVTPNAPEA